MAGDITAVLISYIPYLILDARAFFYSGSTRNDLYRTRNRIKYKSLLVVNCGDCFGEFNENCYVYLFLGCDEFI